MRVLLAIHIALQALQRHVLRTMLTMLGVIIGVAAVTAMMALGQGAQAAVRMQIASLGTNLVIILPGSTTHKGVRQGWGGQVTLRVEDVRAIQQECSAVVFATPLVQTRTQVVYGRQNWTTTVQGTGVEYLSIRDWPLLAGGWFTQQEMEATGKVAILGETVRSMLFGSIDPVGQVIHVKNMPFRIVGVLVPKGHAMGGQDQDDIVFIPYTTAQKQLIGTTSIHTILATAGSRAEVEQAQAQITALLRQRHRVQPDQDEDFAVQSLADLAAAAEESSRILTLLLGSIASISLLVGGIGIMNIMLVSVTERTREIGIRLAIGAKPCDIRWQFLVEALVLSLSGGGVGIALGIGGAQILSATVGWPAMIAWDTVGLAFGCSGAVGILFGFYPAYTAARLQPIQALRYE